MITSITEQGTIQRSRIRELRSRGEGGPITIEIGEGRRGVRRLVAGGSSAAQR